MDALLGIGIAVMAIAAAAGWSFWSRKKVMQPVAAMQAATRRLADGDLDARIAPVGNSDLDALGSDINKLVDTMRAKLAEQQQVNNELRAANDAKVSKDYLDQVVHSYGAFADEVAQGNLAARIQIDNGDALAPLGQRLNAMAERLHSLAKDVQQAQANIAKTAADIMTLTSQQAMMAGKQGAALAETTATVAKVKAITNQTAQQAAQLAQANQATLQATQTGHEVVDQTVGGMNLIKERVDSIAHTISTLNNQTAAISDITQMVMELADQGNMLALNAAIEAARAGEQGRSFADATHRVQHFAERSKAAIDHVQAILRDIQQAVSIATVAIEEGTAGVTQGAAFATQAEQAIGDIARGVETGAQVNAQVAAAAQQQTVGLDQIGQAVDAIEQTTTETLASTRQAEQAAKDLSAWTQSLQQTVAAYRL